MHPWLLEITNPLGGPPVRVTTYAALMFLGAAVGIGLAVLIARRRGVLAPFDAFASGLMGFIGGLVGGRLLFMALHGAEIVAARGWPALLSGGGYVFYGGLFGGAAGFVWYQRRYRLPLLASLDVGVPGLAVGHAFGRLGCFSAGCCHGAPAPESSLAVIFPPGGFAPAGIPLHPVQLYEAGGLLALALVTGVLAWRGGGRPAGFVAAVYLAGYAALRFITETFRGDPRGGHLGPLSPSQVIALVVLVGAAVLAVLQRRRVRTLT